MIRSLWAKFFILLLIVSMIALSAAFVLSKLMLRDFREYTEGQLEDRVYWVIADLEGTYEKYQGWKQEAIAEDAVWALMTGLQVRVIDNAGGFVMDTDRGLDLLSPLVRKRLFAISRLREMRQVGRFLSYPLFHKGQEIGSLQVRFLRPEREDIFVARADTFLLFSLLGIGGLALLLSVVFSRTLTKPLKRLASGAEAIIEGNPGNQVAVEGRDEIGRLSATFNRMSKFLETQESLRKNLVSNVTHEIRTPLSAMRGQIAGMIDGLIPSNREEMLSLHEETERLENILEGIEELSCAQAGALFLRKRIERLKPLLVSVRNRFEKLFLDKEVTLEVRCSDALTVYADPTKLTQIIVNLVSNALRATETGGHVWIGAESGEKGTYIEVGDTGQGIAPENLPRIFERFYRTSEEGLGIGLAIVKELTEAHEGTIKVKSECGKGSIFTVFLPDKGASQIFITPS